MRAPVAVELDDAILLGRVDDVAEDRRAVLARRGLRQHFRQAVAVEDVVAEHQRDRIVADEIAADDEGIGQPARAVLRGIGEAQAELGAVAEQPFEQRLILRRGDDQNVADPASISVDSG